MTSRSSELLNAAKELIEASGCVCPFGDKMDVKSTRRAMKYLAAFEELKIAVRQAERDLKQDAKHDRFMAKVRAL